MKGRETERDKIQRDEKGQREVREEIREDELV